MRKRAALAFVLALLPLSVPQAEAITYFDQVRYRTGSSYSTYPSTSYGNSTCLYHNASGECMIEQYYDPTNVYRNPSYTNPVYDRNYLYDERRYSERYNYRDYDYNYNDYYDNCDRYDRYCDDYYDRYDRYDDFDYERYFGNNHHRRHRDYYDD